MKCLSKNLISLGFAALCSLGTTACVYEPEQFEEKASETSTSGSSSEIGSVYAVNKQKQICNPSVSQDTVNYPGSMLWLNFSGSLNVISKDSSYTTKAIEVKQHDRLTVSNQDNEVQWFMMIDSEAKECQFQDPEWSTHPNFVVSLSAADSVGMKGCVHLDYGIFAARMNDKKRFWFVKTGVGEFGTPHVWVDPSVTVVPDSAASDTTVEGFFGTDKVRLVYVTPGNDIVFADYANGGLSKSIKLKKTAEMNDWLLDSPLISPDGNFIVYNAMSGINVMKSYVQKLSANSAPVEIERTSDMIGEPAQPHWFKYGERLFVTWTEIPDGSIFIKNDLTDKASQDGSAGRTAMREIALDANAPADLAVRWLGPVTEIAPVPTTGGRSPDGKYLASGYQYGFILELP